MAVVPGATVVFLGGVVGFETLIGGNVLSSPAAVTWYTAVSALSFCISAVLEEILFRGLVLHELADALRAWSANALTSLAFVAAQVPHWLWTGGAIKAVLGNAAGVFLLSVLAGWVYLRQTAQPQ
jgi:membrane protease YdiL (CAAX protease family)